MNATTFDPSAWNPRYLAYCKARGFENDPEGLRALDGRSHNIDFMFWVEDNY